MRCPECVKDGKKSRISVGPITATLMMADTYIDEEGRYHSHDLNTYTRHYECSNGHRWTNATKPQCHAPGCLFNVSTEGTSE